MNSSYKFLYKKVLKHILYKSCPSLIPRSGEAGKKVNCYTIEIEKEDGSPYLLVDSLTEKGVSGRIWDNKSYNQKKTVKFETIKNLPIKIVHYYGLYEIRYKGIFDYIFFGYMCPKSYFKILVNKGIQRFYNTKRLFFRHNRLNLLRLLVEKQLEDPSGSVSSWEIMDDLYTIKWYGHPKGNELHDKLKLFLASFVETKEIERIGGSGHHYKVTGLALKSLEDADLEERRHQENIDIQRRITYLTLVIACTAVAALWDKGMLDSFGEILRGWRCDP